MRPTKLRLIDSQCVLVFDLKTDATERVVLDDRARLMKGPLSSGSSISTFGKVSPTMRNGLDGGNRGTKNLVAGRHITQGASTIIFVWSFVMIQDCRAKTRAKLFEERPARSSSKSFKKQPESGR